MALDPDPPERPDHAAREPSTGKGVVRRGAEAAESDIDIATKGSPRDLTSSDEGTYESGQRDTGGAEAIGGHILDDNGNTFDVEIDWLDDEGNVLVTYAPSELTNVSDVTFNIVARSDHFELRVKDNSGATSVHGTANAH